MIACTVIRGLSDAYGSWKTIWMLRRSSRISVALTESISLPLNRTEPDVAGSRRSSMRPVVDLPHPDSPTRPSVSPRRTWKLTPQTACTTPTWRRTRPARTGKCLTRSVASRMISRSGAGGAPATSLTAEAISRPSS